MDTRPTLHGVVERNIHALLEAQARDEQTKSVEQRIVDGITRFAGSMKFVYVHALLVGGWLVVNMGLVPGVRPFDPFPFVMLAMIASVEAIFLSTFVLISQNRMGELSARRAHLDLQVNLLAEHELTTLIGAVDAIATKLGVDGLERAHLDALKEEVEPEVVLQEIEEAERRHERDHNHNHGHARRHVGDDPGPERFSPPPSTRPRASMR